MCYASLRGVDSHGINLLPHYLKSAKSGRKNINPKFKIKRKFPTIFSLDADNAFGHAASLFAVKESMKVARKYGLAAVSVYNSSHTGSLAVTCLEPAKKDFICIGFTNADALMLSYNSKETFFGTNPICITAPRLEKNPFCFDSATSMISWNKLLNYKTQEKKLNGDFAADKYGNITYDPKFANSLLPFGGYKGFGLASVVEIFSSIYSGSKICKDILPMFTSPIKKKRNISHFYLLLRIDGKQSKIEFKKSLQRLTDRIRNQKPKIKKNKVLMPNDPEIFIEDERKKKGIPLSKELFSEFKHLSIENKINSIFIK